MSDTGDDDAFLNAYFADARADAPVPSAALLARIAEDAGRAQPTHAPVQHAPRGGGLSLWQRLTGWSALAGGLTAATLAGVWIGYNPPAQLDLLSNTLLGADAQLTAELVPSLDSYYLFEG